MRYADRREAGRALARALRESPLEDALVLAVPRGGVPVAAEVARAFRWPLDVLVSRKLGAPGQPELALGAVSEGGMAWVDRALAHRLGVTDEELARAIDATAAEVLQRAHRFRPGRPFPDVHGRTVVLVDDGIAVGATVRAALRTLRPLRPARIVLAVPVASREAVQSLRDEVEELVVPLVPEDLFAIGACYRDFTQVEDDEVDRILEESRRRPAELEYPLSTADGTDRLVRVHAAGATLMGDLAIPHGARGVVAFAHGSGSSRHSHRNRAVAQKLREAGLATLLFDLLTDDEGEEDRASSALRFDLPLLTRRLLGAVDWLAARDDVGHLPVGLFGASTGAAAALVVATLRPSRVRAVVSRGGRPDLARPSLPAVRAPTLLVVGGDDTDVLALNEDAFERLTCPKRLVVVPGATHLFEEPGALDDVAHAAARWFVDRFAAGPTAPSPAAH